MIVIDSSVIYALLDDKDRNHQKAADWYLDSLPALATTPLILAEVDHLAGARAGRVAQQAWRRDLEAGVYDVTWWADATRESARIAEQYGDLRVGLADASLVALAARLGVVEIAAFDERHFRVMRPKRVATRSGCYPQTPDSRSSPACHERRSSEATANGMRSITPRPSLTGRVAADFHSLHRQTRVVRQLTEVLL